MPAQTERIRQEETRILDALSALYVRAGDEISLTFAALSPLPAIKEELLKLKLNWDKFTTTSVDKRILSTGENGVRTMPPELGDAEITIAGIPRISGTGASVAADVLKGLAALGVSAALVTFVTKSDDVPEDARKVGGVVADTVRSVSIPLILILLLVLFLLKEFNKV